MQKLKFTTDVTLFWLRHHEKISNYWNERDIPEKKKELYKQVFEKKVGKTETSLKVTPYLAEFFVKFPEH